MEMKNKLYKHHKRKVTFFLRNFSFAFFGLIAVIGSIAIPTYINVKTNENMMASAASEKSEKQSENEEVNQEEEELLEFNELENQ